jgi:hypothetical protein
LYNSPNIWSLVSASAVPQNELEAMEKRQSQYSQMETHLTKLQKEVKLQQEALADYNTVLDKVHSQDGEPEAFVVQVAACA